MNAVLSNLAKKQLRKLPKVVQFSIASVVRNLVQGNTVSNVKPLVKYKDIYRIRIADYRMVYKKFSDHYFIILIEHRKSVYETLKRLW